MTVDRPSRRISNAGSIVGSTIAQHLSEDSKIMRDISHTYNVVDLKEQFRQHKINKDQHFNRTKEIVANPHLSAFQGDIESLEIAISLNPSIVHSLFDYHLSPTKSLLSEREKNNAFFSPPISSLEQLQEALRLSEGNMSLDQRWMLTFDFGKSSILHYAVLNNQFKIVKFLIEDLHVDHTVLNSAGKPPSYYIPKSSMGDQLRNFFYGLSKEKMDRTINNADKKPGKRNHQRKKSLLDHLHDPDPEQNKTNATLTNENKSQSGSSPKKQRGKSLLKSSRRSVSKRKEKKSESYNIQENIGVSKENRDDLTPAMVNETTSKL